MSQSWLRLRRVWFKQPVWKLFASHEHFSASVARTGACGAVLYQQPDFPHLFTERAGMWARLDMTYVSDLRSVEPNEKIVVGPPMGVMQ
jgi:hypothetical protein